MIFYALFIIFLMSPEKNLIDFIISIDSAEWMAGFAFVYLMTSLLSILIICACDSIKDFFNEGGNE